MNRLALPLIMAILLSACSPNEVDGSASLKQTRDDKIFTMTVELVSPSEITQFCSKLGVSYDANGCSSFNLDTKHCTIYVMPQRFTEDKERLTIIGHETWHCRFGRWHD